MWHWGSGKRTEHPVSWLKSSNVKMPVSHCAILIRRGRPKRSAQYVSRTANTHHNLLRRPLSLESVRADDIDLCMLRDSAMVAPQLIQNEGSHESFIRGLQNAKHTACSRIQGSFCLLCNFTNSALSTMEYSGQNLSMNDVTRESRVSSLGRSNAALDSSYAMSSGDKCEG